MLRFILPLSLIGASVATLLVFVIPSYEKVTALKQEVAQKNSSLDQSKVLEAEREKLSKKYNEISEENRRRLEKLLPDNVDNIRLIIEINDVVASAYGMSLKDIRYDSSKKEGTPGQVQTTSTAIAPDNNPYGTWNLEFTTEGSYDNFLNFLSALERNLRMVDVSSISFSSEVEKNKNNPGDVYKYSFKIKTYWLKN